MRLVLYFGGISVNLQSLFQHGRAALFKRQNGERRGWALDAQSGQFRGKFTPSAPSVAVRRGSPRRVALSAPWLLRTTLLRNLPGIAGGSAHALAKWKEELRCRRGSKARSRS